MSNYEKYQLQWMINHGYSLSQFMQELQNMQFNDPEDSDRISTPITELFEEWQDDSGFNSEIWACEAEWKEYEGKEENKGGEEENDYEVELESPIQVYANELYSENINRSLKVLIDNGIDKDEASTILQAIGYTLIDTELFPET